MAYCLQPGEDLAAGLKRVAREEVSQAIACAANPGVDRDEAVHSIRKCMKKVRAVLRMIRGELGEKVYKCESACFRDTAKTLAEQRETAVLAETIEKLESQFAEQFSPGAFDTLARTLRDNRDAVREKALGQEDALDKVAKTLRQARKRVKGWPVKSKDFSIVAPGIRQVYKKGRQGFRAVTNEPSDLTVHEWRKSVKNLWYHMRMLEATWPAVMGAFVAELDALGDLLGEDHDLADLRTFLATNPECAGEEARQQAIIALIERRQGELRTAARVLGPRVYAEKPAAFAARLEVYWSAPHPTSAK